MSEAILQQAYWKRRLREAHSKDRLWNAVFLCPEGKWKAIEAKHRSILARCIGPNESVLDCACGYGRLVGMMPLEWSGAYVGVDLCEDFLRLARATNPDRTFLQGDLRDLGWLIHPTGEYEYNYDWAVIVSVRPMVIRHLGSEVWEGMRQQIKTVAKKLLFLEYDENDEGSIE